MCDGVRAAPEPGLSGEHRPDPDTGSGGSEHYKVITDICINDISVTQQQQKFVWAVFWEWRLDYARAGELRAGAWDTRPHSGVAGGHHRPIGRCRSDNSGSISRFCHKHAADSHFGGGTENWRLAGHTGLRLRARCWGHLLSHPRVTTSPSSSLSLSGDHQDKVTVTPPRNKPFVFDPHQRLYTVLQESNADLLRELSDVTDIQEEPDLTCPDLGPGPELDNLESRY